MNLKIVSLFLAFFIPFGGVSTPVQAPVESETLIFSNPLENRETIQLSYRTQSGSGELTVYLAQTSAEKEQGLMGVESLLEDHGMMFIYEEMGRPVFWMKNMQISLDFVYLDAQGIVVDLLENIAPCLEVDDARCDRYAPKALSQYVLEVPEGWVKEVGLQVGDEYELDQNSL